jgi:hypothetical protein
MADEEDGLPEVWEHPFAEVVDRKLEPIKNDLQQLRKDLDEVAGRQNEAILRTQWFLARLQVRVVHNESLKHVNRKKDIFPQFVAELTAALKNIDTSQDPLSVAQEFLGKRWQDLEDLGVKPLKI